MKELKDIKIAGTNFGPAVVKYEDEAMFIKIRMDEEQRRIDAKEPATAFFGNRTLEQKTQLLKETYAQLKEAYTEWDAANNPKTVKAAEVNGDADKPKK